jgi:DNA-binding CsgD family transcriptional regulator
MVDLMLTESRQSALRRLLTAEPVPGEPLPPRPVMDAIADLVPCDVLAATLTDGQGRRLQQLYLAPGPDRRTRVVGRPWGPRVHHDGKGPHRLGWIHWTAHPEPAGGSCRLSGADQLAIGFRNGVDHVVQLEFSRESRVFSEEELALLRMLVPVLARLVRERPAAGLPASLTVSERRVLREVAAGCSNAEIATTLCIAECTVRKHLENAYRKLGVSNRMAAVARLRGADRDEVDLRSRLETFA